MSLYCVVWFFEHNVFLLHSLNIVQRWLRIISAVVLQRPQFWILNIKQYPLQSSIIICMEIKISEVKFILYIYLSTRLLVLNVQLLSWYFYSVAGLPHADIICSMLGKYCAAAAFMATYQQGSELYPTVLRSLGMGMSCTIAMVVSLIIPYLIYLVRFLSCIFKH